MRSRAFFTAVSPTRRRVFVLLAGGAGLLVAAVGVVLVSLPFVVDLPRVQGLVRSEATRLLDRPVRFERVTLSYWPLPAVRVRRLTVANPPGFGPDPLLSVEEARVRVRLLPLLAGRVQFGEVTLARPRVVLEQRPDGTWNIPAPGGTRPAPAAPFVLVSRVRLREGHVEFRVPGEPGRPALAHLVDRIDLTLDDLGWSRPITFKLTARLPGGGIAATLEGTVGPLAEAGADLAAVPARLAARFTAEESRPPADAPVALTGKGEGEVRVAGTLGRMAGGGRLRFARLVVTHRPANCPSGAVRSLSLEGVDLPVQVEGGTLAVRPFALRVAGGSVQGDATLTWRAGTPGVRLARIRVRGVAAEPVLVDFLCQPYAVTGRVDGSGEVSFTGLGDDLLRSARGTWEARVGAGRFVGPAALQLLAGVVRVGTAVYSVVNLDAPRTLFASPLEFQSIAATASVGGAQVRGRDLVMVSRELRVTGEGTYGLVDTRLDFNLNVHTGRAAFAVKIGGTAHEPSYAAGQRGVLKGVADALSPLLGPQRKGQSGASSSPESTRSPR